MRIVLGGGIAGASTALHLRRTGSRRSCSWSATSPGSGRAASISAACASRAARCGELPLARRARRLWAELPRLIGTDGEFTVTGHLRLARSEADMASHRAALPRRRRLRPRFRAPRPQRAAGALSLAGSRSSGGSFAAEDGQANPRLVSPAFAEAARGAGVEILERTEITGGEVDGRRILPDGRRRAGIRQPSPVQLRRRLGGESGGLVRRGCRPQARDPPDPGDRALASSHRPRAGRHRRRSLSAPDRARQCAFRRRRRPHLRTTG